MGSTTGIFAAARATPFATGPATNPDDRATKKAVANKYFDMVAL